MAQAARAARAQIPKRGLGLGRAIRRIREMHGIGQEVLAERSGLSPDHVPHFSLDTQSFSTYD